MKLYERIELRKQITATKGLAPQGCSRFLKVFAREEIHGIVIPYTDEGVAKEATIPWDLVEVAVAAVEVSETEAR